MVAKGQSEAGSVSHGMANGKATSYLRGMLTHLALAPCNWPGGIAPATAQEQI